MNTILAIQQYLAAHNTSIDTIILLILALLGLFMIAYVIELDKAKKLKEINKFKSN